MDYQLKPLGKTCVKTGKEFQPGEACFSAVIERADGWVRLDFSSEAWQGPPDGAIGYWKCRVPGGGEVRRRTLDPEVLMRYFEQLSEEAVPSQEPFRYVLALLLVQRRKLRIEDSRGERETAILELSGSRGEGPFEVREFELSDGEIEALQSELNARLAARMQ